MSPKLMDYRKSDRKKIIETSAGTGVGYALAKEKAAYKKMKPLIFKLINLTALAAEAAHGEEVFPFKTGTIVSIQNDKGKIGQAPDNVAKVIVKIMDQNLRFNGHVSSIIKGEKELSIEVTLIAG
jgi:transposase